MTEKLEDKTNSEEFKCIREGTIKACETCDGFGRNSDRKINTSKCYSSYKHTIKYSEEDSLPKA